MQQEHELFQLRGSNLRPIELEWMSRLSLGCAIFLHQQEAESVSFYSSKSSIYHSMSVLGAYVALEQQDKSPYFAKHVHIVSTVSESVSDLLLSHHYAAAALGHIPNKESVRNRTQPRAVWETTSHRHDTWWFEATCWKCKSEKRLHALSPWSANCQSYVLNFPSYAFSV